MPSVIPEGLPGSLFRITPLGGGCLLPAAAASPAGQPALAQTSASAPGPRVGKQPQAAGTRALGSRQTKTARGRKQLAVPSGGMHRPCGCG